MEFCNDCDGMGWQWVETTNYGVRGQYSRPCPKCNLEEYAKWSEAGQKGREVNSMLHFQAKLQEIEFEAAAQYGLSRDEWLSLESRSGKVSFKPLSKAERGLYDAVMLQASRLLHGGKTFR